MDGEKLDNKIEKRLAAKKLAAPRDEDDEIPWDRKPESLSSVHNTASASHPELKGKPTFSASDVWADPSDTGSTFKRQMPQVFFVNAAGGKFAIDTQGYDYARYAVRIK